MGQVFLVCDGSYGVLCSLEVLVPFLQGKNDGEKFSIVYIIVLLCGKKVYEK